MRVRTPQYNVALMNSRERFKVCLSAHGATSRHCAVAAPWYRSVTTVVALILLLLAAPIFTSCSEHESSESSLSESATMVSLSLRTMSITSTYEGYEDGTTWENYIDISGRDYRIYFFTYNPSAPNDEATNNKYISTFYPASFHETGSSDYTRYTISGSVDDDMSEYSAFKVVVLANWGHYMEGSDLIPGSTTIDELCESTASDYSTFSAISGFIPDADNHIPFYGVHEFDGIEWVEHETTSLDEAITLLRAMARVELIVEDVDEEFTFESVSLVNCNESGYCAPSGVYLKEQYDHDGVWSQDFVDELHLVGGSNSATQLTLPFTKSSTEDGREKWIIYVPEHDNSGTDYSYIDIEWFNTHYSVHFANYSGGKTTYDANGDPDDRYDIFRNYLYRFFVSDELGGITISVDDWKYVFDNEWSYGDMSRVLDVGEDFYTDDGVGYRVVTSDYDEGTETGTLEVYIETGTSQYTGYFTIPETVYYLGYTYTVSGISARCFDGDTELVSLDIPATVTYIGEQAFQNCSSLTSIYLHSSTPPECAEETFHNDATDSINIFVPEGSKDAYSADDTWREFTIYEINYDN